MKLKSAALLLVVIATVARLSAQLYLVNDAGGGFQTHYTGSYNLGYEFTVGISPLNVTALGFYAPIPLHDSHQVALWNTSGGLLATVVIPAGVNPLTNQFAFQNLASPVLLSANTNYILSAFWSTNIDVVSANFSAGSNPIFHGATLVGSRSSPFGAPSLLFPVNGSANGFSWIGASMVFTPVPEPSTYSAGAVLMAGLAVAFKIGRRRNRPAGNKSLV